MNAIEQATNLKMISKIEAIVYIFKSKFPGIVVDFKPWLKNSNTENYEDKNSIDIGFHFPIIKLFESKEENIDLCESNEEKKRRIE